MAFTFFFRDFQTLEIAVEHMIPYVIGRCKIKIWDAGCASGQEPYTLAIMLAEKMGKYIFKNLEIHATDIDESNLFGKIIQDGIYSYQDLKRIPVDLFEKYFRQVDDDMFQINSELRGKIKFKRENLLSLNPTSYEMSLVLCKNVLLHQNYDQRVQILKMFYNSLSKGGYLVMEQTQKLPDEVSLLFEPICSNAQIFRKIEQNECLEMV